MRACVCWSAHTLEMRNCGRRTVGTSRRALKDCHLWLPILLQNMSSRFVSRMTKCPTCVESTKNARHLLARSFSHVLVIERENPANPAAAIVAAASNWVLGMVRGAEGSAEDTFFRSAVASRCSGMLSILALCERGLFGHSAKQGSAAGIFAVDPRFGFRSIRKSELTLRQAQEVVT